MTGTFYSARCTDVLDSLPLAPLEFVLVAGSAPPLVGAAQQGPRHPPMGGPSLKTSCLLCTQRHCIRCFSNHVFRNRNLPGGHCFRNVCEMVQMAVSILYVHTGDSLGHTPQNDLQGWPTLADRTGSTLGRLGADLGATFGRLGLTLSRLGVEFGPTLGRFWADFGWIVGRLCADLGSTPGFLGPIDRR